MSKLTPAQRVMVRMLNHAKEIHYGVMWWGLFAGKTRDSRRALDGRTCNSLMRSGVLVKVEGSSTLYELADEYKNKVV